MKKYSDYSKTGNNEDLTDEEFSKIIFPKYKIVVPSLEDKEELMEAFKHIHDSDVDNDNIIINNLMHLYHENDIIIVDEKLFKKISK